MNGYFDANNDTNKKLTKNILLSKFQTKINVLKSKVNKFLNQKLNALINLFLMIL
jgi:hypothetical protein